MPRGPRIVLPGQPHHVTHRGNNRENIFLDKIDCEYQLELLQKNSVKSACDIHAYVLMSNHLHLLVTPREEESLSALMQKIGTSYSRHFNRRYGRTGGIWDGPYSSVLVDSDSYFFACSMYIEMNPVRALIVDHPGQHESSSFHRNAMGVADELVTPHPLYNALALDRIDRHTHYLSLFKSRLDTDVIEKIRNSTKTNGILADGKRIEEMEASTERRLLRRKWGAVQPTSQRERRHDVDARRQTHSQSDDEVSQERQDDRSDGQSRS